MRLALLALLACSCDQPVMRCTDDLAGVYVVDDTATRWTVLDDRRGLEAYPLFDDTTQVVPGLEVAPRVLDLRRTDDAALAGEVSRRYMLGAARCDAKARARVVACKDDTLEIVLADPAPPIGFQPCAWGQAAPSRRERWHRVK